MPVRYPSDDSDKKLQIGCNIHQLTELCQHQASRQKPPGAASYFPKNGGLFRPDHRKVPQD
jgi:hypothetical protein